MKKLFATRVQTTEVDLVLLLLRLCVGYAFIMAGWGKIQTPFAWAPPVLPIPSLFQALAAVAEFGGGIALVLGLLTRLGALGLAITMAVAVYVHAFVFGDPFINPTGGGSYQVALVYFLIALLYLTNGPGKFSLDYKVFGVKS